MILLQAKMKQHGIEKILINYNKLSPQDSETFESMVFGWRITNGKYQENLLEKVLEKSENEKLIDLIWSTFKLWQKGFLLNLVCNCDVLT